MVLTYKKKRGNAKELPHTEVYDGVNLLGYYLSNDSKFSAVDENWNFCNTSNNPKLTYFYAKTQNQLQARLEEMYTK